jgi:predicted Zn-dependent peptidase
MKTLHPVPKKQLRIPNPVVFTRNQTTQNQVLFVNYDMVQAEILWYNNSNIAYDSSRTPIVTLFNEYFGGGMSSVVFQTIRESKALAYSTYSRYSQPTKKADPYTTTAYVGTQADKLNDAVGAMNELLQNLPPNQNMFDAAKAAISNNIETERTNDADIIFAYAANQKLGLTSDINQLIYENLPKLKLTDLESFHQNNYKNKPYTYCVMGSADKIKMSDLEKYGKVTAVTLEEIFGY